MQFWNCQENKSEASETEKGDARANLVHEKTMQNKNNKI